MPPTPSFLNTLPPDDREALLRAGRPQRWGSTERMIRAGDRADTALVLLSGVVKVHVSGPDGDEMILGLFGGGDLLGEIAAIPDTVRSADVTVLDATEGVVIPVARLRQVLTERPALTLALLDLVLLRLRAADRRRLEFATAESLPRVASRLVELADRFGVAGPTGVIELAMPITQDELAAWSGASRESTARALRTLRELGLIETRRRHLTVLDLERLRTHGPRP